MSADLPHILVVDDDDRLRELLRIYLTENGFLVATAANAADARAKLQGLRFDLVVLDVMMPGESGLTLAKDLSRNNVAPVLMLTAMGDPDQRIAGFEHGVDDYLSKPFGPRELVLRIPSILRRMPPTPAAVVQVRLGDCIFDMAREELRRGDATVHLTSVEAALLKTLAEQPGTVISREDLLANTGANGGGRAIDVQVTRLRRKFEPNPKLPRYLQTVRSRGYVLRPD